MGYRRIFIMACCCNGTNNGVCCSQMLVQLNRVYNGARIRTPIVDQVLLLSDFSSGYTLPLTYISAEGEGTATIVTQSVTPLPDGRRRIVITYNVPVTVVMRDATNLIVTASSFITRTLDVLMTLPSRPYTFEVAYAFSSRIGTINDDLTATVTGCLLTVLKVLVKCEVIIKPCGCITYPDAVLTEDVDCQAVFNTDI